MSENKIQNISWSASDRNKLISKLKSEKFDIIIIGGGITGAGVFRDIMMRATDVKEDLKILLIDKNDFAFGTSNRSSKLAHGGIRYLALGDFEVVKESTTERDWLRNNFPNLVRPQAFMYCAYKGAESKSTIKMGLSIYDKLAENNNYKKYRWLTHEELIEMEPKLDIETTVGKGAGLYYDTNINDARLTLESIKEGVFRGGIAVNYVKVDSLLKNDDKVIGVNVIDVINEQQFQIKAKKVINATGIWIDSLLENQTDKIIRPTKGVHIIVPKENVGNNVAMTFRAEDKRTFFCIPRGDFDLIGTTDTDYNGSYNEVYCKKEDADYLIRSIKKYFPKAKLNYSEIISSYAGLRPLINEPGKSEGAVSRKHMIIESENGMITISGGKLTIFRLMAEQLVKKLIELNDLDIPFKENLTKELYLISYKKSDWEKDNSKIDINLEEDILNYLYQEYGKGINTIITIIRDNPEMKKRLITKRPFILGEIQYILEHEFVPKVIDVLYRRTEIWMLIHPSQQPNVAQEVADLMASYYSWSNDKREKEIKEYLDQIYKNSFFYVK